MSLRMGKSAWTRTRAVLSLGMVFGLGAVGTMAAWSSSATATTGVFSVGSIPIEMKVNDDRPNAAFTTLAATGLMPLETTAATLVVKNTGPGSFTYTAKASATGDAGMAGFLTLTAFSGATVAGTGNAKTCSNGSNIGSTTLAVGTSKPLITTARALGGSAPSETLCFQIQLSGGVTKATNGKSATAIIEFNAIGT
ncbi:SipW-dependent-type signal peptide-containing protein [Rhodococcus hoagii]|nr:SipW-dependent-type signal peptide-containing protein [Prescottella equi]